MSFSIVVGSAGFSLIHPAIAFLFLAARVLSSVHSQLGCVFSVFFACCVGGSAPDANESSPRLGPSSPSPRPLTGGDRHQANCKDLVRHMRQNGAHGGRSLKIRLVLALAVQL